MHNSWKRGWKADAETMEIGPRWTVGSSALHKDKDGKPDSKWRKFPESHPSRQKSYLQNTKFTIGGGYRDTWIQVLQRNNTNPGPGHYKKETSMPVGECSGTDWVYTTNGPADGKNYRDEFNVVNTRAERGPRYTFRGTPPQGTTTTEAARNPAGRFTVREVSVDLMPDKKTKMKNWMKAPKDGGCLNSLKPSFQQVPAGANSVKVTPGPGEYEQRTTFGAASGGSRQHYFPERPPTPQKRTYD